MPTKQKTTDELERLRAEHKRTIQMLLARDIAFRETSEKLLQEKRENERTIKMLFQRDIDLRRSNERLEAMDREKSEFISVAAHQLRTPLTAIKWLGELLRTSVSKTDDAVLREYVAKLNEVVAKVMHLVGDILNVSRIEEGRFGVALKPGNIRELLDNIVKSADVLAQSRTVALSASIAASLPAVSFDPVKLRLAIGNIIDNAIKYTPSGGSVLVEANAAGGSVRVTVRDTGIGIPEKEQKRLFDKFFRGNKALKQETEGTGLGLFIARNILEAHKGSIAVASKEGKGAAFTITLPVHQQQEQQAQSYAGKENNPAR